MDVLIIALPLIGIGTLALGAVHLVIPLLADVDTAIPAGGRPLRPLPVVGGRYATRRRDVLGIVWGSNNAASYVLLTLGAADLVAATWIGASAGRLLALWAAGWSAVRSASQLTFGRRAEDLLLMSVFAGFAAFHLAAAA